MKKEVFFIACLFAWMATAAQQYPFVRYTPKDGLINSRVHNICQDSKGRMYFLTYGGLSVYDGARFKNYTSQDGLATDLTNDLIEAGEDSFLVATNTSSLNTLVHGKIKSFETEDHFYPITNRFVKCSDGSVYSIADDGLFKLNKNKFEKLSFDMPGDQGPYLGDAAEHGNYLVITTNDLRGYRGLYLYNKKDKLLSDALPGFCSISIAKDKSNHVWVSNCDSICQLDETALANGKLKPVSLPANFHQATPFVTPSFDFDGKYAWMPYRGSQLIRAGKDGSLLQINMPNEHGQVDIEKVFIDKENIIWVISRTSGVFKLINTSLQINKSLAYDGSVISQVFYVRDTTWTITTNNTISRQTKSGAQSFESNVPHLGTIRQIGNNIFSIAGNHFYAAAVPSSSDRKINFQLQWGLPDSNGFSEAMIHDRYGNYITTDRYHISVFHDKRLVFRYPIPLSDMVAQLAFDRHGRLWVTARSGVTVFELHPDKPAQYLEPIYRISAEIEQASPRCMVFDKNEVAWIGTRYHGLIGLVLENGQFKKIVQYRIPQGLTDDFITSLACDSANNILVGTQSGLDRLIQIAPGKYRLENITKSNGVFGYIFTTWVDRYNQSFALLSGGAVLQIAPMQSPKQYEPRLFIEEMKINGEAVHAGAQMRLPYTQRNLSFNMAAPAFANEKQVEFSYLLQGSGNDKWSEPSTNPDLNFLNLSPGQYVLEVKANFPSTNYSPGHISYAFEIVPPWWRTKWFMLGAIICLVAAIVIAIRFYYQRKLGRQRVVLERQQAIQKERTRIATDMHDDMGASLSRIKFLSETIGIKKQRHEPIEEDIYKIREYSHSMIDKMGEIVWALNEKNDSLSDLLSYTRAYAVEYLSQNNIQCSVEAPEQFESIFLSGEFRRNIYLTVKEALHNIVKHSQATKVKIDIITNDRLIIQIADNGIGFDETKIRPFSNGLVNMKKRLSTLGGSLGVKNEMGTTIIISAPLKS